MPKSRYTLIVEGLSSMTRSADIKRKMEAYGDVKEVERDVRERCALVRFKRRVVRPARHSARQPVLHSCAPIESRWSGQTFAQPSSPTTSTCIDSDANGWPSVSSLETA